ncbi:MAG TPA: hypothetical protein VK845_15465, partial [Gemmatimonadales bacterium]|nr:hypothetical protein [Gemmatimonadales bacterium]
VVSNAAQIYHAQAEKWLPITVHPDYKRATQIIGDQSAHPTARTRTSDTTRRTRWARESKPDRLTPPPSLPPELPAQSPKPSWRRPRSKSLDGLPLLEPADSSDESADLDFALGPEPLPLESERPASAPVSHADPTPSHADAPAANGDTPPVSPSPAPIEELVQTATGDFDQPPASAPPDSGEVVPGEAGEWLPDLEFPEMVSPTPIRGRSAVRGDRSRGLGRKLVGAAGLLGIVVVGWLGLSLLGGKTGGAEEAGPNSTSSPPADSAMAPVAANATGSNQAVLPATTRAVAGGSAAATRPSRNSGSSETAYVAAYAAARAQFDSVMSGVDFNGMFDAPRLQTESGLLTALSQIRATMNAVQLYRSREMAIEAAHPGVEVSERERADVAGTVDSLLSAMDATYGLLLSQYGRYRLADGTLLFSNPAAEQEYVDLTRRIGRHGRILQRLNRERPTLTGTRIAQGMTGPSLPRLGTVIEAPTLKKLPSVNVQIEGPQWDSIDAERRARLTDSIIKAGMERPPQAPTP